MAWDRIRQFLFGEPPASQVDTVEPNDQQKIGMIATMGQRMVDVVNESVQIAGHSKNIETCRSRVRVVQERIAELQELAADYPFLKIERLADVERDLEKIERETDRLESPSSTPRWTEVAPAAIRRAAGIANALLAMNIGLGDWKLAGHPIKPCLNYDFQACFWAT